jgi:hypothetical protein
MRRLRRHRLLGPTPVIPVAGSSFSSKSPALQVHSKRRPGTSPHITQNEPLLTPWGGRNGELSGVVYLRRWPESGKLLYVVRPPVPGINAEGHPPDTRRYSPIRRKLPWWTSGGPCRSCHPRKPRTPYSCLLHKLPSPQLCMQIIHLLLQELAESWHQLLLPIFHPGRPQWTHVRTFDLVIPCSEWTSR